MVKEIKDGFEAMVRPIIQARALRDDLAAQAKISLVTNWHGANVHKVNLQIGDHKKPQQLNRENKRM